MKKRKGILQKISIYMGIVSSLLAIACGVIFYIKVEELGYNNPISASLLASIIFFVSVGVVLILIGKSDIPNLKIDTSKEKK
jgi:vacuolar-type H+-ATPase subunit I/STV1